MALDSQVLVGNNVKVPTGYTRPVDSINLVNITEHLIILTTSAPTVDNANAITGLTALLADIKTQIDGTELAALGVEFTVNNIDATYTLVKSERVHGASIYLDTDNFESTVQINWDKVA